jgi:hypothetical protein
MSSCKVPVKVIPNASRDEILGWLGDSLKIRISAPPTDGQANARLCEFIAKQLKISRGFVAVVSGANSRQKILSLQDLTREELNLRIPR